MNSLKWADIQRLEKAKFYEMIEEVFASEDLSFSTFDRLTENQLKIIEPLFVNFLFYHSEQIAYLKAINYLKNLEENCKKLKIDPAKITKIYILVHSLNDPCIECQQAQNFFTRKLFETFPDKKDFFHPFLSGGKEYKYSKASSLELTPNDFTEEGFYNHYKFIQTDFTEQGETRTETESLESVKFFEPSL